MSMNRTSKLLWTKLGAIFEDPNFCDYIYIPQDFRFLRDSQLRRNKKIIDP